ncbi:polyphosphate kinase 2 family protein [Cronbergia sp. UHCC 0137]|uniref:polyphosphate kinase 2 family protein n=1 Tax=Cronbergia sp. UHCC 0137 TaxID=3110239 RepID=UPI002B1FF5B1|nr:polyphosphate kinase 2 family protein [Cronbergia sp. UHCC 0137]MEA5617771.1 polyphosphate kinase 2 family protein [Cronbergia sp. UHCC 0137]
MNHDPFIVSPGSKISLLKDYNPAYKDDVLEKSDGKKKFKTEIEQLAIYQHILYAQNTHAVLILFQAMDAAGKDSTIKHVMSGINPQGCQVFSFKMPSTEELDHDYLWRSVKALPERGRIGIFNRSYYEELLIVRVHPEILAKQNLPLIPENNQIWQQRFEEINNFEKYLTNNGVVILKFFLNVSKEKQKERFLERIATPEKHWKFSLSDVRERAFWDDYMEAYEQVFNHTSTEWAPWYIIPADTKWFTRLVVANIIRKKLQELNLQYPQVSEQHRQRLLQAKEVLEAEE